MVEEDNKNKWAKALNVGKNISQTASKGVGDALSMAYGGNAGDAISSLGSSFQSLGRILGDTSGSAGKLAGITTGLTGNLTKLGGTVINVADTFTKLQVGMLNTSLASFSLVGRGKELPGLFNQIESSLVSAQEATGEDWGEINRQFIALGNISGKVSQGFRDIASSGSAAMTAEQALAERGAALTKIMQISKVTGVEYSDTLKLIGSAHKNLGESADQAMHSFAFLNRGISDTGLTMPQGISMVQDMTESMKMLGVSSMDAAKAIAFATKKQQEMAAQGSYTFRSPQQAAESMGKVMSGVQKATEDLGSALFYTGMQGGGMSEAFDWMFGEMDPSQRAAQMMGSIAQMTTGGDLLTVEEARDQGREEEFFAQNRIIQEQFGTSSPQETAKVVSLMQTAAEGGEGADTAMVQLEDMQKGEKQLLGDLLSTAKDNLPKMRSATEQTRSLLSKIFADVHGGAAENVRKAVVETEGSRATIQKGADLSGKLRSGIGQGVDWALDRSPEQVRDQKTLTNDSPRQQARDQEALADQFIAQSKTDSTYKGIPRDTLENIEGAIKSGTITNQKSFNKFIDSQDRSETQKEALKKIFHKAAENTSTIERIEQQNTSEEIQKEKTRIETTTIKPPPERKPLQINVNQAGDIGLGERRPTTLQMSAIGKNREGFSSLGNPLQTNLDYSSMRRKEVVEKLKANTTSPTINTTTSDQVLGPNESSTSPTQGETQASNVDSQSTNQSIDVTVTVEVADNMLKVIDKKISERIVKPGIAT